MNVITKWGKHLLQSGAAFFLLQSEANCVTKWGSSFITKWGRFYYKVEQVLQSGASFITKWGRYYKVGHYYKVAHNSCEAAMFGPKNTIFILKILILPVYILT